MREQTSLVQDTLAHLRKIGEGRFVSEPGKRFTHLWKYGLGPITKTEQGFLTSQSSTGFGDCNDFIRLHGLRSRLPRISTKRAVPAIVTTEICQRDEDFLRIGNPISSQAIRQVASGFKQRTEFVATSSANQNRGGSPGHNSFARKRKRIIE